MSSTGPTIPPLTFPEEPAADPFDTYEAESDQYDPSLVFVVSPFSASPALGGVADPTSLDNIQYARVCMMDCIRRGEVPVAGHLLYPQILDDSREDERLTGIACGHTLLAACDKIAVYTDRGISAGMMADISAAARSGEVDITWRNLPEIGSEEARALHQPAPLFPMPGDMAEMPAGAALRNLVEGIDLDVASGVMESILSEAEGEAYNTKMIVKDFLDWIVSCIRQRPVHLDTPKGDITLPRWTHRDRE